MSNIVLPTKHLALLAVELKRRTDVFGTVEQIAHILTQTNLDAIHNLYDDVPRDHDTEARFIDAVKFQANEYEARFPLPSTRIYGLCRCYAYQCSSLPLWPLSRATTMISYLEGTALYEYFKGIGVKTGWVWNEEQDE